MQRTKDVTDWRERWFSHSELREMSVLTGTFSAVSGAAQTTVVVDLPGKLDGETTNASFVTDDYFSVIGIRPTNGPGFTRASSDARLVAVISDAMWEDVFARGDVAGKSLNVNDVPVRIVGVAPPRFTGAAESRRVIWMPLSARSAVLARGGGSALALSSPDSMLFEVFARLAPGVSPEQASAAIRVIDSRAVAQIEPPTSNGNTLAMVYDADVVPMRGMTNVGSNDMGLIIVVWGTITLLVLLVVCTNVSGLVVSAAAGRRQEIAIRLSLGASRARVMRQLLTESTLLALIGGALGLATFWGIIEALSHIPDVEFIRPDVATVGFTMAVALGTGVLFGLTPALHATRRGFAEVLRGTDTGATRRSRAQQIFVVAQVMFSQPLLVLITSLIGGIVLAKPPALPPGVADHVLRLSIASYEIPGTDTMKMAAAKRLRQRIAESPGVRQVVPDIDPARIATLSIHPDDRGRLARANDPVTVDMQYVHPGYFALLDWPLRRGDDVATADTSGAMVISSDLARELWGSADPIGRRLTQVSAGPELNRGVVVTGVYDARYSVKGGSRAIVYRPVKGDWLRTQFLIRTASPAADLAPSIRRIAREELPSTPVEIPLTLTQVDAANMSQARTIQGGAAASGALVLLLTSIGLYGVVALGVAQRRREIGIRMAVGARAQQVVGLFYAQGVKLAATGLILGLPLSLVAMRVLSSHTASTNNPEPTSLWLIGTVVVGVVVVVASAATLLPATRAATVNPVTALRGD
jgi:predicted permease